MLGKLALQQFSMVAKTISPAEKAALTHGTKGFESSIFAGAPDWQGLFDTPPPSLTAEEQSFLDNEVERLCQMVDPWKIREELHDLPPEVWSFLKEHKFFGMIIPKEYGGLEFSAQAHSAVIAKIASRCGTAAVTAMVPNSLGPAELLMRYGTQDQRDYYLPRLASGEEIPCFSLTSPQAGSDAANQKDEGVVFKGEDGELYLRMNWEKRYITLAPIATLMGIAFQLKDPEGLIKGDGVAKDYGITLALVPGDTPGITKGMRHHPIGMPFQNGPHWGKDVVAPLSSVIGGQDNAGKGWGMLMECLAVGRSISLPASSLGMAHSLVRATGAYAYVRQQFGLPIAKQEGVEEALARMGGLTYMMNAAHILPLQELDLSHAKGEDAQPVIASAILKYHMTEAARRIALDAMDIHAGKGVVDGPNNPAIEAYLGIPVAITVEGANILTRNMIIFGQAAFLAHPYVSEEMKAVDLAATDRKGAEAAAGSLLLKHMFNTAACAVKSFWHGLTNSHFASAPHSGPDQRFYQHIDRLSAAFGISGNLSMMTLQAALKRKERTSALLADGLSNLYLASQVLRKWNLDGRPEADKPLMEWACQTCLYKAEQALGEMVDNHPSWFARAVLGPTVLPRGYLIDKPSHKLDAQVAEILTTPGEARDRLTAGMYMPTGENEYLTRLEDAFVSAHAAYDLEKSLRRHVKDGHLSQAEDHAAMIKEALDKGLITAEQEQILSGAHVNRFDIVGVDCFPQEWNGAPLNPNGPIVP